MSKKDIKFPARTKASAADLKKESTPASEIPIIGAQPPAPATDPATGQLQLKPFPDGVPLRHTPNPRKPGTFILHDSTGLPLAITLHQSVAELLCRSVCFLFIKQAEAAAKRDAAADALVDAVPTNVEPLPTSTPDANKQS